MAAPSRYELERQKLIGRGYDLRRDGEPAGELRRRGIFRARYEFDCGPHRWLAHRYGSGDRPVELIDRETNEVVALVHPDSGGLEVLDPVLRPRVELAQGTVEGEIAWVDPEGRAWVTFSTVRPDAKVKVEAFGPSAPWPAEKPAASFLIVVALGLCRIVWRIDERAASSS